MDPYQELAQKIKKSRRIVFFTGAGMSTESGIPDFRSNDGLFKVSKKALNYSPEAILSATFFKHYPELFFDYYFKHLIFSNAKPNLGHRWIAELEKTGKDITVVTQNIDGLHQKAGSSKVLELHGSVLNNYCLNCGRYYSLEDLKRDDQGIPRCLDDGGVVRPDVVLYEESLPLDTFDEAIQQIKKADMLVVLGTSLVVHPAAGLIHYFKGPYFVVVNKTPINTGLNQGMVFQSSIVEVLTKVKEWM